MKITYIVIFIVSQIFSGCRKPGSSPPHATVIQSSVSISTDKARYNPGDDVVFTIDKSLPVTVKIRYKHLNDIIGEESLQGTSWGWKVPSDDFKGYMTDLYDTIDGKEKIYGSIAVDVSSDWKYFPRYGFLSKFGQMNTNDINLVINDLNRHHINGLQFYDWENKHHQPLAGTVTSPDNTWTDIGNRETFLSTVEQYISSARNHNIKAMFYNLAYGALNDASSDFVSDEWYLYTDRVHLQKYVLDLANPPFKSNIYFLDPSNASWQQYIGSKNNDVYTVFNFDGYHVDQVGNLNKNVYSYSGNIIDLPSTFAPFLNSMKQYGPDKSLVMNAVNQYGQQGIASADVDFLYTEVWSPNEGYKDLATIIQNNDALCNYSKKSVVAAYMDYNLAGSPGYFNTPGVLLSDAVIFSFGGAHIELGEHMLGKEYFPNNNLRMKSDLISSLISYYDFLVAYENLLRDGGSFNNPEISSSDNQIALNTWPPQSGSVSVVGKNMNKRQVIHLINLANATSLDWRDANGTQPVPKLFHNFALIFKSNATVKKVWLASPDINSGTSTELQFLQAGKTVSFTVPSLRYWDMIVVEY